MRRRAFIASFGGGALAWPLTAHAQPAAMPVVGFLDARSPHAIAERLRGFRLGLKDTGFVEGENVAIVYRFAENQLDRLPVLVAELVRRPVAVIVTAGDDVAVAAKVAATSTPVVFIASQDPVKLGLVASVARPGGNVTGVNFIATELVAKRLELLHELVPGAARIAVLVNLANRANAEPTMRDVQAAARARKLQIQVHNVSTRQEIDAAFATFVSERPDALFVATDVFLSSRHVQLVTLATRHGIPATFPNREAAEIGGLMTYGANILDVWRQTGAYVGRILKGAKPADMPVMQVAKFEFVINAQTARALGLAVSQSLLVAADEVIE
jgi:putative ABC transport system substrate-binding protein